MKILKKLFGKLSEKSNKSPEPVVEKELDIDTPVVYTIVVDENGEITFYFQCKEGYEELFGSFLNQLISGIYNEQIILGINDVFDKNTFVKIVNGMKNSATELDELEKSLKQSQVDIPVIMPSQVFSGIGGK